MDAEIRALERLEREYARAQRPPRSIVGPLKRVSMADVASLAGVSGQTVSRVVNDSPRVDPATRTRVEAAMERLGYRPHRAARALRTGRTHTIGLVAATLTTVGNSRMLQAVADAAAVRGYALTVVTLGAPGAASAQPAAQASHAGPSAHGAQAEPSAQAAPGNITAAFERLRDQGVDGAIVLNEATALARGTAASTDLALVVVDSPPDPRFGIVATDHAGGARLAVQHLLALGHPTVHHLAGPAASFAAAERERGWREALGEAGVTAPDVLRGDWTAASGRNAGATLARVTAVSAVFSANDQMALGLLHAMADAGRRVPQDVSVVGFDDVADAADYRPPLTTVRQDFDALGERAVAALVGAIDGTSERALATVPARLIERESAGAYVAPARP